MPTRILPPVGVAEVVEDGFERVDLVALPEFGVAQDMARAQSNPDVMRVVFIWCIWFFGCSLLVRKASFVRVSSKN